jgi:hypothetical protein
MKIDGKRDYRLVDWVVPLLKFCVARRLEVWPSSEAAEAQFH